MNAEDEARVRELIAEDLERRERERRAAIEARGDQNRWEAFRAAVQEDVRRIHEYESDIRQYEMDLRRLEEEALREKREQEKLSTFAATVNRYVALFGRMPSWRRRFVQRFRRWLGLEQGPPGCP